MQGEELAATAAGLGFDGVDITVRKGGHMEPASGRKGSPTARGHLRKHGLEVPMVTTDIADAETPFTEDILKACAALGIRNYRFGAFKWDAAKPYEAQLVHAAAPGEACRAQHALPECAMYHTHSGAGVVGASIWDLWYLMRDLDPKSVGVNFDVSHAMIEGGLGGWIDSFKITGNHLRGIAVKDFAWGEGRQGRIPGAVEAHRRRHGQTAGVLRHGGADTLRGSPANPLRVSAGRRAITAPAP